MSTLAALALAAVSGYLTAASAESLCKKYDASPRQVGRQYIGELRKLIGYE